MNTPAGHVPNRANSRIPILNTAVGSAFSQETAMFYVGLCDRISDFLWRPLSGSNVSGLDPSSAQFLHLEEMWVV